VGSATLAIAVDGPVAVSMQAWWQRLQRCIDLSRVDNFWDDPTIEKDDVESPLAGRRFTVARICIGILTYRAEAQAETRNKVDVGRLGAIASSHSNSPLVENKCT
jgi:hypothetical protein